MNKTIKKYAVPALITLAIIAVFVLLFLGASYLLNAGDKRGEVVAQYDGNLVYEEDIADLVNYLLVTAARDNGEQVSIDDNLAQAVQTYVKYKVLELNLEENGYKIDEKKLEEAYNEAKKQIETTQTYEEWMEYYYVSEDFLMEDVRRAEIAKLYHSVYGVTVSEKEAKDYYNAHAMSDYRAPAGYYWDSVVLPVDDITDTEQANAAKAEMEGYLAQIKAGTMTLAEVHDAVAKYNDSPYSIYDGEDILERDSMTVYEDEAALEAALAEIDKTYENRDPNAADDSEEKKAYLNYLAKTFQAKVYYNLQHMEVGSVCDEVLVSFPGYYIIQLDSYKDENGFMTFAEVSEEIYDILRTEKEQESIEAYMDALESTYRVYYYV